MNNLAGMILFKRAKDGNWKQTDERLALELMPNKSEREGTVPDLSINVLSELAKSTANLGIDVKFVQVRTYEDKTRQLVLVNV